MIDPTRHRQLEELDQVGLCVQILSQARNELYLNMRFLDIPLSSLGFEAEWNSRGIRTDGFNIYYNPDWLIAVYRQGRVRVNRAYLHMLFHCLFGHLDSRGERDQAYWNLACDIAMESVLDGLYQKCTHIQPGAPRRETYLRIRNMLGQQVLTAQGAYKALVEMNPGERRFAQLAAEFFVDDHSHWGEAEPPRQAIQRQNKWKDNRERMQTEMETGSKDASEDNKSLLDELEVENRERYDYRRFLRRFAVLKEEIQMDMDSFDYAFYTYGLSLYGNMPLIEPQESREVYRVEDFAVVIDTSMSCSGELVRRFLEETYDVLSQSESFFRRINVHIIQCDDQVQSDVVVREAEELKDYMNRLTLKGLGGTDFRPAFDYVNGLRAAGEFTRLRGLIYFTDGKGIYPVQAPPYDTAFVFVKDQYSDESVPPWAMKVILEAEDLLPPGPGDAGKGRDSKRDVERLRAEVRAEGKTGQNEDQERMT